MRKAFSLVMALVLAVFISGRASAANWVVVDPGEEDDGIQIVTLVDKDSIRRGTVSKKFPKFSRNDGFSAIVRIDVKIKGSDDTPMTYLISFYEENGVRKYILLDDYDATYDRKESDLFAEDVDTDGDVWPTVWNFVKSNLK